MAGLAVAAAQAAVGVLQAAVAVVVAVANRFPNLTKPIADCEMNSSANCVTLERVADRPPLSDDCIAASPHAA
ncbi:hypothetical protein GCM10023156_34800 [Novipirellula rosea]|uniref:Secreted protein n=1 Tax=Novipirellula rosea TaxID=1031540 RepID=A0ABP8N1H6_9BACT